MFSSLKPMAFRAGWHAFSSITGGPHMTQMPVSAAGKSEALAIDSFTKPTKPRLSQVNRKSRISFLRNIKWSWETHAFDKVSIGPVRSPSQIVVGCGTAEVMIKRKLTSVEKANQEALPLRSLLSSWADVGVDRLRADLLTPLLGEVWHASKTDLITLD